LPLSLSPCHLQAVALRHGALQAGESFTSSN